MANGLQCVVDATLLFFGLGQRSCKVVVVFRCRAWLFACALTLLTPPFFRSTCPPLTAAATAATATAALSRCGHPNERQQQQPPRHGLHTDVTVAHGGRDVRSRREGRDRQGRIGRSVRPRLEDQDHGQRDAGTHVRNLLDGCGGRMSYEE